MPETSDIHASPLRLALRRMLRRRIAVAALGIFALYALMVLTVSAAQWAYGHRWLRPDRDRLVFKALALDPGAQYDQTEPQAPLLVHRVHTSWGENLRAGLSHPLGTDKIGRDVLAMTVEGARAAFIIGLVISAVATAVGFVLGAAAGYFGGLVDDVVTWLIQVVFSIPGLLLIIGVAYAVTALGKAGGGDYDGLVFVAIGLISWVGAARVVRGEFLKLKDAEYVLAARALGGGNLRIVLNHIGRNTLHLVIILFSLGLVRAINYLVILNFLDIAQGGRPTWGGVISSAREELFGARSIWWPIVSVTVAMFLLVWSVNVAGDRLRDALDPNLRSEGAG